MVRVRAEAKGLDLVFEPGTLPLVPVFGDESKVRQILLEHRSPDTPVGVVKNAYREEQEVVLTDLASLQPEDVDMLTVVVVGNSQTRLVAGRMVTLRGYLV